MLSLFSGSKIPTGANQSFTVPVDVTQTAM